MLYWELQCCTLSFYVYLVVVLWFLIVSLLNYLNTLLLHYSTFINKYDLFNNIYCYKSNGFVNVVAWWNIFIYLNFSNLYAFLMSVQHLNQNQMELCMCFWFNLNLWNLLVSSPSVAILISISSWVYQFCAGRSGSNQSNGYWLYNCGLADWQGDFFSLLIFNLQKPAAGLSLSNFR